MLAAIAEIDEQFPDYGRLLEDLATWLQRIAVYQVVGIADVEDEIDEGELAEFASSITDEDVQLFYQVALIGRRDLYLAPDPKSGAEMTLLRMLAFQPGGAVRQPAGGERRGNVAPKPAATENRSAAPRPEKPPGPNAVWADPEWSELIDQLNISGACKLMAGNCAYVRREQNIVHLCLDGKSESLLSAMLTGNGLPPV